MFHRVHWLNIGANGTEQAIGAADKLLEFGQIVLTVGGRNHAPIGPKHAVKFYECRVQIRHMIEHMVG